ncbi:galactosylceramide sulfotransferase [Bufo gargarizans]|uniref:galactosylceramide sulfotransferase n=1 Tax=Bufo gargarizans TaxID=30331 RepID=UPI001CF3B437|nr:galactosylceramide sulfotransferase [Bufo gargarizans]XP_044144419.1 galactosylceramide sulfotransferase [Bufo gargarizans]
MTCAQMQGKVCRSVWKGLVLGTLLTTFVILLYSYAAPPLSFSSTENPTSFQCRPSSLRESTLPGSNSSANSELHCLPRHNLMFLKTHKTGSSTILNILFRYGEKHRLRFAFPRGRNDFDYPSYFQRWQVEGYHPGLCYNIICNHLRYHHSEVNLLIPPHTVFVTVLRNPALLFESSFQYFARIVPLTWKLPGATSEQKMDTFLRNPRNYYDSNGFSAHYLHNLLTFDLGYDNEMDIEDSAVSNLLKQLDSRFHLIMLLEYFDESLLLLRDLMCWNMDDILYFKLNARKDSTGSRLSPEIYRLAQQWNALDALIYQHFNATFWKKVEKYGVERMKMDVLELRRRNEELKQECIAGGGPVDASKIQESGLQPWQPLGKISIQGYNLRKNISPKHRQLCRNMLTPELQYMSRLGADLWVTRLWSKIRALLNW